MIRAPWMSYLLLLLCGVFSVFWGVSLQRTAPAKSLDFKLVYFGARCLLSGCDPYSANDLERMYQADEDRRPNDPTIRRVETNIIYLPTIFAVVAPFALLPWSLANGLWMLLTAGTFLIAGCLAWNLGAHYAPQLALALCCLVMAGCQILFLTENAAGLAVSLCIIAVWCLLRERLIAVGVVCLALSLVIKPHDTGFVWLFFLLAGAAHRKRALAALVVAALLSLPAMLWITNTSPHWVHELHRNLVTTASRGDMNDPGPESVTGFTPNSIISLQTVLSVLWDDPVFYNSATLVICVPFLVLWAIKVWRSKYSFEGSLVALASVISLTMLVTYHRTYDAKLILLTIPACAMLWARMDKIAQWAFALTTIGVVFTGDIAMGIVSAMAGRLHLNDAGLAGKVLLLLLDRPEPIILSAMAVFYTWFYLRRFSEEAGSTDSSLRAAAPNLTTRA